MKKWCDAKSATGNVIQVISQNLHNKMYSRAERKFLISDVSNTNPKLGPGCYTKDNLGLTLDRRLQKAG
jgi:hypothetical protein